MKTFVGIVQEGTKRASALGFPTANIVFENDAVSGIYAGTITIGGEEHYAAVYADKGRKLLEAHVLDEVPDMYGKNVTVQLMHKIRDDEHFESDAALQAAVEKDVERVREYFEQRS